MIKKIFIFSFLVLNISIAYATREYLIPGYGGISETSTRQYLIPGDGFVNETQSTSAVAHRVVINNALLNNAKFGH